MHIKLIKLLGFLSVYHTFYKVVRSLKQVSWFWFLYGKPKVVVQSDFYVGDYSTEARWRLELGGVYRSHPKITHDPGSTKKGHNSTWMRVEALRDLKNQSRPLSTRLDSGVWHEEKINKFQSGKEEGGGKEGHWIHLDRVQRASFPTRCKLKHRSEGRELPKFKGSRKAVQKI